MYQQSKRMFDILISLILSPFAGIIILLAIVAIKLEEKGPAFYYAQRIGKNREIFRMYKLRSMYVNAPDIRLEDGSTFNSEDDSRITKVGRLLRKTSIDELPQIFNVLKGDMSFIGPRPDSANWVDEYTEEEKVIHTVRPGITGYNQAIHRNAVGTKEKLQNDIYYVKHMSLLFDIKIIVLTVKILLIPKNVYRQ
ncbi:MAG: sugar transferase [Candidatus Pristimantibacillus lignocellulolyticus]|uniref:Sugar transferase n=1 Tax=Candidatus Pristimantibacillus lignocellulolyticus TaxID=2994561 RepID=A0A9J6ZDM0_9BACL|nr:MAG: sugar transferase [Candidatus Pristimantibacillus lignocellulolyticus]